jgi:hypothetical protein
MEVRRRSIRSRRRSQGRKERPQSQRLRHQERKASRRSRPLLTATAKDNVWNRESGCPINVKLDNLDELALPVVEGVYLFRVLDRVVLVRVSTKRYSWLLSVTDFVDD